MEKKRRIKQESIDKLKEYLVDYIKEWSSINHSNKFRCFNSYSHRRNDADPSAAIVPGSREKSWTCFGCGAKGDIFTAVMHREGIKSFREQIEFLSRKYSVALEFEGEGNKQNSFKYFYQDEKGRTVYRIDRKEYFEEEIRKKKFSMLKRTDSGWASGLDGIKRYPYRLPQVLEAIKNNDVIFFVEGEKCVHQIIDLGLIGTTTLGGARSFKAHSGEYVQYFKGANVVILPDNDENGRQYAEDVLNSLRGIAASVRKLELPNLLEKGDVVDWVLAGGTKEELLKLVKAAEKQGPVFEENFCYCKFHKDNKVKLSNFIINPKYMIKGEDQSLISAELITEDGITVNKVLKGEDFNDVIPFRKAVEGFEISYFGRAEELQHIKVLVSKKDYAVKMGIDCTGFHKIENKWYFVSEQGALDECCKESEDIVLLEDFGELRTDILKAEAINREELLTLAPALFTYNTLNITSTVIGYVSGLFLKERLRAVGIKYNHLIIEGQSGSGKSSTIEAVITPLLSFKGSSLNAGECTNFALNKAASSSNFLPVIIDEYKPHFMAKHRVDSISNVMRNSYDGQVVVKGVANLKKNREFNARASVILCGEVGMEETANIERSLKVVFSTANHSKERRNSIKLLKNNSRLLNKLGRSLLKGGLEMSDNRLRALHDSIYEKLSGKDFANERVRNSVTNCMLGIALLKEIFDKLQIDFYEVSGVDINEVLKSIRQTAFSDLLDYGHSSKGIIEESLETMNRMAVNRLLERGYDYDSTMDIDGDFVLRLNYNAFYDRFAKFCKDHNVSHEVLPLPSFKRQLNKLSYCKCYNKPTSFLTRDSLLSKSKTFRAAVINVEGLDKKNVDVEYMLDRDM